MSQRLSIRGTAPPPVKERPECLGCGKRLRPYLSTVYERVQTSGGGYCDRPVAREWLGSYHGPHDAFCSTACLQGFGWSFAKFFLDGGDAAKLADKSAARLPRLRLSRETKKNMRMARDLIDTKE